MSEIPTGLTIRDVNRDRKFEPYKVTEETNNFVLGHLIHVDIKLQY